MTEQILVVPANQLTELIEENPGLHDFEEERLEKIIQIHGEFKPRDEMEHNLNSNRLFLIWQCIIKMMKF